MACISGVDMSGKCAVLLYVISFEMEEGAGQLLKMGSRNLRTLLRKLRN